MKKLHFLLFFAVLLLFGGCQESEEDNAQSSFDRSAMLTAYADNFILQQFSQYGNIVKSVVSFASFVIFLLKFQGLNKS